MFVTFKAAQNLHLIIYVTYSHIALGYIAATVPITRSLCYFIRY